MDARDVVADLTAESDELDALVAPLPGSEWTRPTPAAGWTIAHQIAHLAWTDRAALVAITDPAAFTVHLDVALASAESFVDQGAEDFLDEPVHVPAELRLDRNQGFA